MTWEAKSEFVPPNSQAISIPIADTIAPANNHNIRHAAYPVKQPQEEANEFLIEVRATRINSCREKLLRLQIIKFPWAELLLALSTLVFGTSLGALTSSISYTGDSVLWFFYFLFLPILGSVMITAYFFLRVFNPVDVAKLAQDALEDLPDPTKSI